MVEQKNKIGGRVFIGLVFLVIGLLMLLSNFDVLEFSIPRVIFSWQVILIIIGAVIIINSNDISGYIILAIGTIFLLSNYYGFNAWNLWPVILIILGVHLLLNRGKSCKSHRRQFIGQDGHHGKEINDDILDETVIFGGGKKYITSKNFMGGKITAIFGGAEIDLYNAQLSPGENVVDIIAIFGGVSFYVPRDWKVIIKVTPLFGGVNDERRREPNFSYSEDKVLIIKGTVIFGGGEIKGV